MKCVRDPERGSKENRITGATGLTVPWVEDEGVSSFPSNLLDIDPLCQVGAPPTPRPTASDVGMAGAVPFAYIDALPFPGLDAGSRFTITDEDRGIKKESSLNSSKR